ncbi:CDP-glycerol glycerophosphotransferase family protein [Rarobacter faecitabidus]|uniref:CDP-glycerol glycerophosphotransferase n=2 Tax=Rarobacter faecitabidus TaxID=13243 RepID=A0A542ZVK4_RARFA|nr:CDP-glycerol glycerophosphotransferase [Rarobacter faecitabidus]
MSIPLIAAGRLVTWVIPRDKNRWVFGSDYGFGDGALATLRAAQRRGIGDVTWIARDEDERSAALDAGVPSEVRGSRRAMWRTARAGVAVATHGVADVDRYTITGAYFIQLWHGIPFKKIHLDTAQSFGDASPGVRQRMMRWLYRRSTNRISLLPAAGERAAILLRGAFGIPAGRVAALGEPRTDALWQGSEDERSAAARDVLAAALDVTELPRRLVLFAPTWRDGKPDPAVPSEDQWEDLERWCTDNDAWLVLRPHPLSVSAYTPPAAASRVKLLASSVLGDPTAVLAAFDALITDFSSIAYDFAITGRPIHFLAPDAAEYLASRGAYTSLEEFAGRPVARSWRQVLAQVADAFDTLPSSHSVELVGLWQDHNDGKSADRVVERALADLSARQRKPLRDEPVDGPGGEPV